MKKLIPALLVIGLMFQACEPSPKDKLKQAQEDIQDAAEEAAEEIKEAAEEAGEELNEVVEEIEADTVAEKKGEGKKIKKLLGKLKNKK